MSTFNNYFLQCRSSLLSFTWETVVIYNYGLYWLLDVFRKGLDSAKILAPRIYQDVPQTKKARCALKAGEHSAPAAIRILSISGHINTDVYSCWAALDIDRAAFVRMPTACWSWYLIRLRKCTLLRSTAKFSGCCLRTCRMSSGFRVAKTSSAEAGKVQNELQNWLSEAGMCFSFMAYAAFW